MKKHYNTIIIGAGLTGLTVAHKLQLANPSHSLLVIDKARSAGGVIKTHRDGGFIAEQGPHGFLDNCKESRQLLLETGLDQESVKAPLIEFVRYVYLRGKLQMIPQTPLKILAAPLISWPAKARVALEIFKPYLEGEPTVAKWVNHRFGPALLPYLDAVYTGTYAGDFDRLTIDSVMPGVRKLEKEYGSVLRALLAKQKEQRKNRKGKEKFTMPAMTSFPQGMERLVARLREPLVEGKTYSPATTAISLAKDQDGQWQIATTAGQFAATELVLALPVNRSLQLLRTLTDSMPQTAVASTWIATAVFGFSDRVAIPKGFGFLTPEQEGRFLLGTLFSSNMFPGRAPKGHQLIETLVGGRRHPERLDLSDEELCRKALQDVNEILGIKERPVYSKILRSEGGIPQLERNYPALLAWRDAFQDQHHNLAICGFGWEGIGLNDMIKTATRVAEQLMSKTRGSRHDELKGIYF